MRDDNVSVSFTEVAVPTGLEFVTNNVYVTLSPDERYGSTSMWSTNKSI